MSAIVKSIDHTALQALAQSGEIRETEAESTPKGWKVIVQLGRERRELTAQRSGQARIFKRLDTVTKYLNEAGIEKFSVNTTHYSPTAIATTLRPDRSSAMKDAHEAARYDAWFKDQVQESIDDESPVFSHKEVSAMFDKKKAALMATMSPGELSQLETMRSARKSRR